MALQDLSGELRLERQGSQELTQQFAKAKASWEVERNELKSLVAQVKPKTQRKCFCLRESNPTNTFMKHRHTCSCWWARGISQVTCARWITHGHEVLVAQTVRVRAHPSVLNHIRALSEASASCCCLVCQIDPISRAVPVVEPPDRKLSRPQRLINKTAEPWKHKARSSALRACL